MHNKAKQFRNLAGGVTAVFGGILFFAAASAFSAPAGPQAKAGPTEAMFPHMDAALGYLRCAQTQLKQAHYSENRDKARQLVDAAYAHVQKGIDDYMAAHPGATRNEATPEPPPAEGAQFPHLNGALGCLEQAQTHLNEAAHQYYDQRALGLEETKQAIGFIRTEIKQASAATAAHHK